MVSIWYLCACVHGCTVYLRHFNLFYCFIHLVGHCKIWLLKIPNLITCTSTMFKSMQQLQKLLVFLCWVSVLMMRANQWLQQQPGSSVFSCETLEKKVYETADIYGQSLQYTAKGNSSMRIKGLRLEWQKICYWDAFKQLWKCAVHSTCIATSNITASSIHLLLCYILTAWGGMTEGMF